MTLSTDSGAVDDDASTDSATAEHLAVRSLLVAVERSFVTSALSIAIFSSFLVFVAPARLATWLAVRIAVSVVALVLVRRLAASGSTSGSWPDRVRARLVVIMGVSGVVWGLVPLIVADQPSQWFAVVVLWIFGNQSVITTVCAADRSVYAAAIGTVTLVGVASVAVGGDGFAMVLIVIVLLGGAYSWSVFSTTHRTVTGSIESELAARRLSDELMARSVELENANAVLAHLAHHDQLTDLLNRRAIMDRLTDDEGRATDDLWIGIADLDRFKQVNDTLGHAAGDVVLRGVAGRWTAALPAEATLGRLGGDEFIIAMPGASGTGPDELMATMLQALAEPIDVAGGASVGAHGIVVGASIGFARVVAGERLGAGLVRADAELYATKRSRRSSLSRVGAHSG